VHTFESMAKDSGEVFLSIPPVDLEEEAEEDLDLDLDLDQGQLFELGL